MSIYIEAIILGVIVNETSIIFVLLKNSSGSLIDFNKCPDAVQVGL